MSAKFYVAYDLVKATREQYERLDKELKRLGAIEVLRSDWVLRSESTAELLREHIKKFIHMNDRLVVVQMGDWASYDALANINTV